jgi:hypothetical protein
MTGTEGRRGPPPDEPRPATRERDFGDSAGEGSGGSGLDRREVGDDAPATPARHNPLDDVMKPVPPPDTPDRS